MRLSRYSVWMGVGCGLAGLAISAFARAGETVGNIMLETGVPADQVAALQTDRQVFSTLKIPETYADLKTLLGTSSNTPEALNAWLEARVKVIVGVDFDISKSVTVLRTNYRYSNMGIYPLVEAPKPADPGVGDKSNGTPPTKVDISMANFGVSTYLSGKSNADLLGLVIDGVGTLPVTSPRVGAIMIGAALFNPVYSADPQNPAAIANSLPRLATFFHEAHHSDGNGKSLDFSTPSAQKGTSSPTSRPVTA